MFQRFATFVRSLSRRSLVLVLLPGMAAAQEPVFDAASVVGGVFDPITHLWDYDGDGHADAIGLKTLRWDDEVRHYLRVYRGVEGESPFQYVAGLTRIDPEVTCFDQLPAFADTGEIGLADGADELVLVYGRHAQVFLPPLVLAQDLALPELARGVAVGDFDGDARGDFAVLLSDSVLVHLAPTDPDFTTVELPLVRESESWNEIFAAELTGDGADDMLVVGRTRAAVRTLAAPGRSPGGAMVSADPVSLAFRFEIEHPMPAVGDIDGDGDADAVIFGMDTYQVLRRTGPASFALEAPRPGGPATDLADVDEDGDLDGICCGGGGEGCPALPPGRSDFEVSLNDGSGGFAPSFSIPGLGARHVAGAADVDGDGDVDLVAGRAVYYAEGGYEPAPELGLASLHPREVADLDGDGDPDFSIGIDGYLRNAGDGTSSFALPVLPDPPPDQAYVGTGFPADFDGDGAVDFLVEAWRGPLYQGMRVLRNLGGGAFEDMGVATFSSPPVSTETTLEPASSIAADIDGDGAQDVAILSEAGAPAGERFTWIWFNEGGGAISQGPNWTGERLVLVEDFTGDGTPDLLTYAAGLRMREGLGGRAFGAPEVVTTAWEFTNGGFVPELDAVAFGDYVIDDGVDLPDGVPDLVAAHRFDGFNPSYTVHLLRGGSTGSAPFDLETYTTLEAHLASTGESVRIHGPDVDGDGWQDLVVDPPPTSREASEVHLRGADGRFDRLATQIVDAAVYVDVDGDGDLDAVSAERVSRARLAQGGSRLQIGAGIAGAGGIAPILGAVGPFRAGGKVELRIRGGCGGAFFELDLVEASPEASGSRGPGARDLPRLRSGRLSGPDGAAGAGSSTFPLWIPRRLAGGVLHLEARIADPAAPGGESRTNVLRIEIAD